MQENEKAGGSKNVAQRDGGPKVSHERDLWSERGHDSPTCVLAHFHCHPGHANCKPSSVYVSILILRHRLRERTAGVIVSYPHLIHEGFHSQVKVVSRYAQVLLRPRRRTRTFSALCIRPSLTSILY